MSSAAPTTAGRTSAPDQNGSNDQVRKPRSTKSSTTDWKDAEANTLAETDIEAEYAAFGFEITGSKPRATGWLPCRAKNREDRNPSAEINVGDGPARGRYRDFGSGDGQSISLWEAGARFGSFGGDWRNARKHFATKAGIELPKGKEDERPADDFEFYDLTAGAALVWCRKKPGIIPQAILDCGGMGSRWSTKTPEQHQQHLITFPCFGSGLLDMPPVGYHSVALSGTGIRKYKGKGVEPETLKTMQKGPPGLIGVRSLRQLADAKVVWIVEGITDLLALTSALPADLPHVAITSGGCSYHPQPEWMQHFAGKQMIVCFDCDKPGQTGAAIWCTALVGLAGTTVRKLVLPYPTEADHGKDLRDYLTEGHSYADLWALAEACEPLDPGDKSNLLEAHQAILQALGVIVVGQVVDTEAIEIFSQKLNKRTLIKDIDRFSINKMTLALGAEVVDEFVSEAAELPVGKYRVGDVRKAIANEASKRHLSQEREIGLGIWRVDDSLVLVGARSADVWSDSGELEKLHAPVLNGQRIKFGSLDWYDRDKLAKHLADARNPWFRKAAIIEAVEIFERWDNWKTPAAADLMAGLVCATWIQTIWPIRPMVAVTGPTTSGKTVLIEGALPSLYGKLASFSEHPTESGFRQDVGDDGKILIVDEFEGDSTDRKKILTLLRSSTRGGRILRGTTNQKGTSFGLRHIVYTGSIELSLPKEADRNRFIVLELKKLPKGRPFGLQIPKPAQLADLGLRLLAATMHTWQAMLDLADELRSKKLGVSGRLVEIYAVPVAAFSLLYGHSEEQTVSMLKAVLADRSQASDAEESDEERLLRDLYESVILLPRGVRVTVSDLLRSQLISDGNGDPVSREQVLRTVGIRVLTDPERLFVNQSLARRELLRNSRFAEMDIGQILIRLPGAERTAAWLGDHSARGVAVPIRAIDALIGGQTATEPEESF